MLNEVVVLLIIVLESSITNFCQIGPSDRPAWPLPLPPLEAIIFTPDQIDNYSTHI